jgi:hypothetical protein
MKDDSPNSRKTSRFGAIFLFSVGALCMGLVASYLQTPSRDIALLVNGVFSNPEYETTTMRAHQHHHAVATAASSTAIAETPQVTWIIAKPLLVEVGVLVLFQALGLPLLAKLALPLRRLRWIRIPKRFVSGNIVRTVRMMQRNSSKTWKTLLKFYTNTSSSKIVQRSKKLIHIFIHHDEDHEVKDEDVCPSSSICDGSRETAIA